MPSGGGSDLTWKVVQVQIVLNSMTYSWSWIFIAFPVFALVLHLSDCQSPSELKYSLQGSRKQRKWYEGIAPWGSRTAKGQLEDSYLFPILKGSSWELTLGSVGLEAWQLCEVENYGAGNSGSANFWRGSGSISEGSHGDSAQWAEGPKRKIGKSLIVWRSLWL